MSSATSVSAPQYDKPTEDLRRSPARTVARRLLALAFVIAISLIFIGTPLHWDPVGSRENRNLAKFPSRPRNYEELKSLSDQIMVYYRDHFAFRNALIRATAVAQFHGLGQEIKARIIVGKQGWLFYASDPNYLADRGLDPFSESDLDAWQRLLENRDRWFRRQGIALFILVPPDKQTIYPEFMPDEFDHPPRPSRLDQLIGRLRERHSPVRIIDFRDTLLEAKRSRQVYFTTDSHWNDDGIYPCYVYLLQCISQVLPQYRFTPLSPDDFVVKVAPWPGDLAQQLDLYYEYHESARQWIRRDFIGKSDTFAKLPGISSTDGPDPSAPRLLTYNDSFTAPMIQFLSANFSHATYSWNAWTEVMDPSPVKDARPDIVLCEFVERKLHDAIPVDPAGIK